MRRCLVGFAKHVARTRYGVDQSIRETLIDLMAQPVNVHVDDVAARFEIIGPRRFEQHRARHHLPGVPNQLLEQEELAALQIDRLRAARDGTAGRIEFEVADAKDRVARVRSVRRRSASIAPGAPKTSRASQDNHRQPARKPSTRSAVVATPLSISTGIPGRAGAGGGPRSARRARAAFDRERAPRKCLRAPSRARLRHPPRGRRCGRSRSGLGRDSPRYARHLRPPARAMEDPCS